MKGRLKVKKVFPSYLIGLYSGGWRNEDYFIKTNVKGIIITLHQS